MSTDLDNIYCTCSGAPDLSTDLIVSISEVVTTTIAGPGTIEEKYGINEKFEYEYDCVPNVGCIPETCVETVCIDECTPKTCTNPCGWYGGKCKTCIPEVCTGKICTDDFIPNCIPKTCTDDICLSASVEIINELKLHFDYQIVLEEIASIGIDGIVQYSYEQKILLSIMFFEGEIKYKQRNDN